MDELTIAQWRQVQAATDDRRAHVAGVVLALLESLRPVVAGFPVDQLTHACQTATRAERAGADAELVAAALCHDLGKAISWENHGAISAEILKPYVATEIYEVIRAHQDFQVQHYGTSLGQDPSARDHHRHEPWFSLAERFTDEWDQASFDPDYDTEPLQHFAPVVRKVFGTRSAARP